MNENLIHHLRHRTEFFKPPMCPIDRLVLDCGTDFVAKKRPKGVRKMTNKECFKNATFLVMQRKYDLEYVEGYASHADLNFPVLHAWCVNKDGEVIDPTWRWPEKSQYRGVVIPYEMLCASLLKHEVYGVLDYGIPNFEVIAAIRDMKGCPAAPAEAALYERRKTNGFEATQNQRQPA